MCIRDRSLTYHQIIPLTDRLHYVVSFTQNEGYCEAVEKLMGIEVPERAKFIRSMGHEMCRISNHLIWLGFLLMDLGAITFQQITFREREYILDLWEMLCGARLTHTYARIGGVAKDIPDGFEEKMRAALEVIPKRMAEYDRLVKENRIFIKRGKNVGIFTSEDCAAWRVTGPTLRAAGVPRDLRKDEPFAAYDQLDFNVCVEYEADVIARYAVRMNEIYESIKGFERVGNWGLMWETVARLPFETAIAKKCKIVQIFDEFQNINAYILDKRRNVIDTMSGSYLDLAERKEAPLIISGSEVHGLLEIARRLTARFKELRNLPEDEAKESIRRYAKTSRTKINEQAEEKIWNLTQGDPLYFKALFFSRHNDTKDYTNEDNIIATYTQEITQGEIYRTWMEYIAAFFLGANERNAKRIMLYLFQAGEERTRAQMIKDLNLDMTDSELETKLRQLIKADLISQGETNFDYKIEKDKTYELVFRRLYQEEIDGFIPDIRKELRQEMGGNANF